MLEVRKIPIERINLEKGEILIREKEIGRKSLRMKIRYMMEHGIKQHKDMIDYLEPSCSIEGCYHEPEYTEYEKCIYCGKFFCFPHRNERSHDCPESFYLAIMRYLISTKDIPKGILRECLKMAEIDKVFKDFYK